MQRFNCGGLNAAFNITGPDYILIEEIDYNQDQGVKPASVKKKKRIKLNKRDKIQLIMRKNDDNILYSIDKNKKADDYNKLIESYICDYIDKAQKEQSMIIHNYDIEYNSSRYSPKSTKKPKEKKVTLKSEDITLFYELTGKTNITLKCKNINWI